MKTFFIFLLLTVFSTKEILAHQPKLINYSPSFDNPHEVIFPEISKAYYGKLEGDPHYYIINSENDFLFYTSILSPKITETYKKKIYKKKTAKKEIQKMK